jgi:hypothetical protein
MTKILVCGSRSRKLDWDFIYETLLSEITMDDTIIEGCCEGSPDKIAEAVALKKWAKLEHHPAKEGVYLNRNLEMLAKCDRVISFWDGYSYGSAFTIARAITQGKPVTVYGITRR